ncbi:VENN motif-containing pre-toxin protein [Serratia fonticola]|uniref:VENN motif-containing pre-toxin protein n=1 Tax=Serratia fonticola TaxID=47917 RepID=A0A542BRX8_SERFO|nr:VENN motif pre-toxin domain-containing protein [Serratia fonticola]TQI81341.1 VENN motif-containing pre-toxin protein [Serratia fonticola]TQI96635.1 VENN motif-containing pre-toxin protein [Serratia fonticola]TVZ71131.1 VENN motif-containing pre-toxin protein [Serratia fonticola]
MVDLSRDVENANPGLDKIFDKEKEQNRLKEAQLIGEIGSQAADIARTQGEINGLKAAKEKYPDKTAEQLRETQEYKDAMKQYGTGSSLQQGIQAATAAIQGLAGGDMAKALAGASAPYLAEVIHKMTTDSNGKVNTEANLMAHAVLGAVTAAVNGNSALAGASGAVMGEYIAQQMYPGISRDDLTEEQRQTISALGTLAAGLAGGIVGDSSANAVAGAQAGKNALENNNLVNVLAAVNKEKPGTVEQWQADKQAEIKKACSGGTPVSCQTMVMAAGSALAWPLLPETAMTTSLIGGSVNTAIQYGFNGTIDVNDVLFAYWTGAATAGTGLIGTVYLNGASGAASSYLKGDNPGVGGLISGTAAGVGYGAGKLLSVGTNGLANWLSDGFDPKFNPVLRNQTEIIGQFTISKDMLPSQLPGMLGNAGSSMVTETINDQAGKETKKLQGDSK